MAYKTISDIFDPVGVAMKAAQLRNMQQQEQQAQLQNQLTQQDIVQQRQRQQYAANPKLVLGSMNNLGTMAQKAMASGNDKLLDRVNNRAQQMQSDPEVAKVLEDAGIGKMSLMKDKKTGDYVQTQEKYFKSDELQGYAQFPGLKVLSTLPEGRYKIQINPVNKSLIGFEEVKEGLPTAMGEKLSNNQLFRGVALGDPLSRKILDEKIKYVGLVSEERGGKMTEEGIDLGAVQVLLTGKAPSLGRGGKNRAKIYNRAGEIAQKNNLSSPKLYGKRAGLTAAQTSYNRQRLNLDADIKIANEFYADIARFKPQIEKLRTNYPSLVNKSLVQIRKIKADPLLGQDAVLAQELDAILSAYIRIARDASNSISEISVGAQEAAKKMLNFNSPAFVLIDQVDNFEDQVRTKINSREKSVNRQFESIEKFATLKKGKKQKETKPRFVIEAVE